MPSSNNNGSNNNHLANGLTAHTNVVDHWPNNVGIVAMEVYFPNTFVSQTDLEKHDQVSKGKYTLGLGQNRMAFVTDREDINSICLTVTKSLLDNHSISPLNVGFLMIGTETIIDKSKSVKTVLMDLFEQSGNTDIEGVHTTNACYGGTAALFHAIDWIESSSWDGRYAMVVAADIALYAKGPARPTGGCAAVAMLIGTDAAIILDRKVRSTHMSNVYDFYKPELSSEYPVVDGPLSNQCYLKSLDRCFQLYFEKANRFKPNVSLNSFDAILFHAPYCKLVQKSIARLILLEFLRDSQAFDNELNKQLEKYRNVKLEDTYNDRELEKLLVKLSEDIFTNKTDPSLLLARELGNSYTASLYACLISFMLSNRMDQLVNNKLLLFSYGSGLSASMFSARVSSDASPGSPLSKLLKGLENIPQNLNRRIQVPPIKYEQVLDERQKYHNMAPYKPKGELSELCSGTYFLVDVSDKHQRKYNRV
jgi:hydroxymethylglutaryl-CoA synthase